MGDLYATKNQRKYTNRKERNAFLLAAKDSPGPVRTLCHVIAMTGCRPSEALALTSDCVDFGIGSLVFRTLKQRNAVRMRAIPVPPDLLADLDLVYDIKAHQKKGEAVRLFPYTRQYVHKHVRAVMHKAGVYGPIACPRGLRHGFGVLAIEVAKDPWMVMKWLGHTDLKNTLVYMAAQGEEERRAIAGTW